jgi:hypothetical protein
MSSEEREQESTMGELPAYLFREHEGRWPQDQGPVRNPRQGVPPDILYQNRSRQQAEADGVPGTPLADWGIQPIYDVLPGNGVKFIESGDGPFDVTFPGIGPTPFFSFTVPDGRVYVFRQIQIEVISITAFNTPDGALVPLDETIISVQRGGSTGFETDNIVLSGFGDTLDIFAIFSAGETFQLFMNEAGELSNVEVGRFIVRLLGDSIRQTPYPDTYATLYRGHE